MDEFSESESDAVALARSLMEPRAFDVVYERHVRPIHAFIAARVGPDAAEDITASTFATAFERRDRFDKAATTARPWLYGIAVNKLKQHREAEGRWLTASRRELAEAISDDLADAEARSDAKELLPVIVRAMQQLTTTERDVLLLHVLGEYSHTEIAQLLGIRRATAKMRLSRGRDRMRREISARSRAPLTATITEVGHEHA